jgi:hypothetical protein
MGNFGKNFNYFKIIIKIPKNEFKKIKRKKNKLLIIKNNKFNNDLKLN